MKPEPAPGAARLVGAKASIGLINLKTAKTLGLTIPPSVLARADEVIQSVDERGAILNQMKTRLDDPPRLVPMTIADVIALPTFSRAYTRANLADIESLEARGVVVTGFLARLRRMDDGISTSR